jgi:hypothetical protein
VQVTKPSANAKCDPHTLLPAKRGLCNKALVESYRHELEQQALLRPVGGAGVVAAEVGVADIREELHLHEHSLSERVEVQYSPIVHVVS